MEYELKIIPDTRIALFRRLTPVTFEDRIKNVEHMARFCNENHIQHLIVDLSQQISNVKALKMFALGAAVPKILSGIQIALVCNPSDKDAHFGETVAANRGALSRSFTTVEEAQKWLEGKDREPNK